MGEERIGHYRLLSLIGAGATASVYRAIHVPSSETVALKVFHAGLWNREDVRRRALAEVEAIRHLDHPKILKLREARLSDERPSVVLELVEGRDLEAFQARLPYVLPELAVLFVLEILEALEFSHFRGVVHRDLKPSNVLIDERGGRVVVSDFGLARMQDASSLTLTGTLVGSPDYMAPEQAQGSEADARSDLFSVAAILYFLVTGTRPFARSMPLATLAAVAKGEFEAPESRNPKISKALAKLLGRGLAVDPTRRFASAAEMRRVFEDYLFSVGLSAEVFSLADWFRAPVDFVYATLNRLSESLVSKAREQLARRDLEGAMGSLSHLSTVASSHPELPRLLAEVHRQRRRRILGWRGKVVGATVGLLLLIVGASYFGFIAERPDEPLAVAPSSEISRPADPRPSLAAVVPRPEVSPSPAPRRAVPMGTVRFEVSDDVKITWNRVPLPAGQRLIRARPGRYPMRLDRPGSSPIESHVEVTLNEPVVIRAR